MLPVQPCRPCAPDSGGQLLGPGSQVFRAHEKDAVAGAQRIGRQCVSVAFVRLFSDNLPEHYQAFAAALPHHSSLVSHLSATQVQVKDTRTALQEAKEALGNKRSDLVQLWTRNQTLEGMLRILDQMCVMIARVL
jgi:hypothetical protein